MKTRSIAIKLDVDTYRGYIEGTPRLLDLLSKRGIKISAYFSFGPDNSGKAIRRIFRPGFISKMLRTRAPSTYGFKTLLYGTLLPAPKIVPAAPDILRRAFEDGHDCGIHAWDHVYVQDELDKISEDEFAALYVCASSLYEEITAHVPSSYAAPGWQETANSRRAIDRLGLSYTSSSRGRSPYYPVVGEHRSSTIEIPTTLPTMDEIYGVDGADDRTIPSMWADALLPDGLNVLTIHTEMEGLSKLDVFDRFIELALDLGYEFVTLRQIYESAIDSPSCEMKMGTLPGRAGRLSVQAI